MYHPVKILPIEVAKLKEVRQVYFDLCQQFLVANPNHRFSTYIASSIANDATIDRQVRAFELYAPYIQPTMKILDWGCRHAPDSCLLRALHPGLELSGCDFMDDNFSVFYDYAKLSFQQIQHEYRIPYPDQTFDTVISSGVLEHVAFEHESLREVWRILKSDGLFHVLFLPNCYSLSERAARLIGSFQGHNRLYHLNQAKNMFLRSGFVIERCGYHQVFPTFAKTFKGGGVLTLAANRAAKFNRVCERVPMIKQLSSNLFFILRRVSNL